MIYVVEDDDSIRELVVYTLNSSGLPSRGFDRPSLFWQAQQQQPPQLLLLDVMLPEEDGLSILARLRQEPATRRLPVMMLTARGSEYDKVVALDQGADDYLPKPFGMMELVARVRALLRRAGSPAAPVEYRLGPLYVCPARHLVQVEGAEVLLTLKEFQLLVLLLEQTGLVVSRSRFLDQVWGYSFDGESRTVDVHIRTLRQKLGAAGELIETVRGIGYKIKDAGQ